jgi:hypothetical protein
MFEMIGLLFDLFILSCLCVLTGCVIALCAWLLFRGRARPKGLILVTSLMPLFSLAYVIFCEIAFTLFVPNQPDVFFGDFNEPVPHGYSLIGLGKMPEYSYFESTPPMAQQPPLLGGVKSLEQDGEMIYGAYGHMNTELPSFKPGYSYFAFDTRNGNVQNFATMSELNTYAGHQIHLVDSENFKSKDSGRLRLRQIEQAVYFGPPLIAFLVCVFCLARCRITRKEALLPASEAS